MSTSNGKGKSPATNGKGKSPAKKTAAKKPAAKKKAAAPKAATTAAPRGRKPRSTEPYKGGAFDFRRPMLPDAELAFSKALAAGGHPSPNTGLLTAKELGDLVRAAQEAEEQGKTPDSYPVLYSFIRRGAALNNAGLCIVSGQEQLAKKPKPSWGVSTKLVDSMGPKDRISTKNIGTTNTPELIPEPLRRCHKDDARDLVIDRENNVLTVDGYDFVVGTTGDNPMPAVMLASGSNYGNYGANLKALKTLSLAKLGGKIKNLVGRFNKSSGKFRLDDGTKPGAQLPIDPNHVIEAWGNLVKGKDVLTCAQIRAAVKAGETKGITFKVLYSPTTEQLLGASITQSEFWQEVKRQMGLASTKRVDADGNETTALERFEAREARSGEETESMSDRSWRNLTTVQNRTDLNETFPFGAVSAQTLTIPVTHHGDKVGKIMVRLVIGSFVGMKHTENRWEADERLNPETSAAPVVESEATPKKTVTAAAAK